MKTLRNRVFIVVGLLAPAAIAITLVVSPGGGTKSPSAEARAHASAPGSTPFLVHTPFRHVTQAVAAAASTTTTTAGAKTNTTTTKTTKTTKTNSTTTTSACGSKTSRTTTKTPATSAAPGKTTQSTAPSVPASSTTTSTTAPTAAPAGGPTFGVSLPSLVNQTAASQAAELANLKSIGITSIRIGADWDWVQPTDASSYDWSQLDQEVTSIRAAGMTVDLVIIGAPPWAAVAGTSGDSSPQPADPAAFASFAATVAARYAPQGVTDFEIWNEPNNAVFWQPAPNAAAYTTLLRDSYAAIKAADPSAYVISGGLAPEEDDGTDIDALTFLGDMFADGAKGSFDAVGWHAYSDPALPNTYEPWSAWSQMGQTPTSVESILAANGDAAAPVWITEVGAPTGGPDAVSDATQAEEFTQAIADAKSTGFIHAMYIYTYEDSGGDPTTDEDWYGLLNADGSQKPAWAAVAAAIG